MAKQRVTSLRTSPEMASPQPARILRTKPAVRPPDSVFVTFMTQRPNRAVTTYVMLLCRFHCEIGIKTRILECLQGSRSHPAPLPAANRHQNWGMNEDQATLYDYITSALISPLRAGSCVRWAPGSAQHIRGQTVRASPQPQPLSPTPASEAI